MTNICTIIIIQKMEKTQVFNRLGYDSKTYQQTLKQSVGSIDYILQTPWDFCSPCLSRNSAQLGRGVATCTNISMVDIDSELQGITRKASRYAGDKYNPDRDGGICKSYTKVAMCPEGNISEDTRLSNPPCNLRSTGWNRWEWLCKNPQERVEIPFDVGVNSQLLARDNHRPVLPRPIDPSSVLPPDNAPMHPSASMQQSCPKVLMTNLPIVSWRDCATIENY